MIIKEFWLHHETRPFMRCLSIIRMCLRCSSVRKCQRIAPSITARVKKPKRSITQSLRTRCGGKCPVLKEATAKSDLDILVELDYRHHIGLEFIQMKLDLESLLHKEVDLVTPEGLSRHVKPIIEKDKVLIYAR